MSAEKYGLLLSGVFAYEPVYNLSSHREKDKGFKIGKFPKTYVSGKLKGPTWKIPRSHHQLCTHHDPHIMIPNKDYALCDSISPMEGITPSFTPLYTAQTLPAIQTNTSLDVVGGVNIMDIIREIVPGGIQVDVLDKIASSRRFLINFYHILHSILW